MRILTLIVIIICSCTLLEAQVPFGFSLDTDGASQYMEVPEDSLFSYGSQNFTVEYWVNKQNTSNNWTNTYGVCKWNTRASIGTNEWTLGLTVGGNNDEPQFVLECGTDVYFKVN